MKKENLPIEHYEDILLILVCENPREECFFGQCKNCPKNEKLSNMISEIMKKK